MTIEQINNLQIADFENMSEEQFQSYKAGLIAGENERLRVISLKARIAAIQDPYGVLQASGCSGSNPSLEFDRIINENDVAKLEEYEAHSAILTSNNVQQNINEQSRKLLKETDWYLIRSVETGIPCPQNILDQRAAARSAIVD